MPANPHRGEVPIELVDGSGTARSFVLRPTWQAAVEIEETLGRGLLATARLVRAAQYGIRDVAAIVAAGLRASGEPAEQEAVAEMVYRTGLVELAGPLDAFLGNLLTGGRPSEGKAEAPAAAPGPGGSTTGSSRAPRRF